MPKFRVWFEQINQTCVEVTAQNPQNAKRAAAAEWRRSDAQPYVVAVEEVPNAG